MAYEELRKLLLHKRHGFGPLVLQPAPAQITPQAGVFTKWQLPSENITGVTELMAGWGATMSYAPTLTGKIMGWITLGTTQSNDNTNVTAGGSFDFMRFGTGSAPANGASATGTKMTSCSGATLIGTWQVGLAPTSNSIFGPTISFYSTGQLTVGTTYWFDMSGNAGTAGKVLELINCTGWIYELPY